MTEFCLYESLTCCVVDNKKKKLAMSHMLRNILLYTRNIKSYIHEMYDKKKKIIFDFYERKKILLSDYIMAIYYIYRYQILNKVMNIIFWNWKKSVGNSLWTHIFNTFINI